MLCHRFVSAVRTQTGAAVFSPFNDSWHKARPIWDKQSGLARRVFRQMETAMDGRVASWGEWVGFTRLCSRWPAVRNIISPWDVSNIITVRIRKPQQKYWYRLEAAAVTWWIFVFFFEKWSSSCREKLGSTNEGFWIWSLTLEQPTVNPLKSL